VVKVPYRLSLGTLFILLVGLSTVIPTSSANAASTVPPPTAQITSTSGVFPLGEVIHGIASDTGGPGLLGVIFYYEDVVTHVSGYVVAPCANCGAGKTTSTWSVKLPSNGVSGIYEFVAQAVDTASSFGPASTGGSFVVAATTNSGATWTGGTGPSGLTYSQSIPLLGISCSSATTCIVVAGNSTGPVAYTTHQ
jgi:hypothetical protein